MQMQRISSIRAGLLCLVVFGSMLLAGCGVGGVSLPSIGAVPTPNAATIVKNVQKVKIRDAAFTFKITSTGKTPIDGSGTGQVTTSPKRSQLALTFTTNGQTITLESISDASTVYTKFTGLDLPGVPAGMWVKSTAGAASSLIDTNSLVDFSQITSPTLVGAETVDGVAVWHLKGTTTQAGVAADTDFYIRRDDNYPYKVTSHTSGADATDATVVFTSINTGITITPPPADQVISQ